MFKSIPSSRIAGRRPVVSAPRAISGTNQDFESLLKSVGGSTVLKFAPSKLGQGNGLFTTAPVKKGDVLLSVPKDACIYLDGEGDINLPDGGEWPCGVEAMNHEEELLPWYIVIAACLLDAKNGQGCEFYRKYIQLFCQPAGTMAQPFLLTDKMRLQFQHPELIDGARRQQDRLETLFPIWMAEREEGRGMVAGFEWAFATVRSRAFAWPFQGLNDENEYAFVPFLDLSNHSRNCNCDFRVYPKPPKTKEEIEAANGAGAGHLPPPVVQLYALRDLGAGEECTISYTGKTNYPNQRMQAQYGFIPQYNGDDRLAFETLNQTDENGDPIEIPAEKRVCAVRLQSLLGTNVWLGLMNGDLPYTEAAIRSLPLRDTGTDEEAPLRESEKQMLLTLLTECKAMMQSMAQGPNGTTLEEDEALLKEGGGKLKDVRMEAAVKYRAERKRLIREVQKIIGMYLDKFYPGSVPQ